MNNIGKWESKMRDLSNDQSTTPPDLVWDNIAKTIKKDKKRRGLYIPFLLLSLLGLSALGISYLTKMKSTLVKTDGLVQLNNVGKQQENITAQIINSDLSNTKEKDAPASATNLSTESRSINTNNKLLAQRETKSKLTVSNIYNTDKRMKTFGSGKPTVPIVEESTSYSNATTNTIEPTESLNKPAILTEFNPLAIQLNLLNTKAVKINSKAKISEDCPSFKNKVEIKFFVEAEGSYGKPSKTMKENPDNSGLYKSRVNSETPWYNWGFGLHGGIFINNNWTISTGINYTQIKEKFATSQRGYTEVKIILDSNGVPIDTTVQTGTLINEAENRFTLLDIPINVGYEYRANNWGLGLETGIDFNISLQTRGKIFNGNQNILAVEDQKDIYKTSLGMGFHASLVFSRYLSDNTSIYLKPGFKTYLKDWTLDTYPLSTSYNLFMLNLGIRHKF